jgi:hypothetical protein
VPAADNQTVARLLREYAQRTALRGGNPYRAKAYSRAADSLAALAVPLHVLIEEDRLTEISGVGEAIADIITKLHRTGGNPGRRSRDADGAGAEAGLPSIEPELREGRGEIERALKGKLPKLVADRDLHGILHCHTDASDGTETLETMANATRKRGFQYFGVADHSKSAHYAGGLSLEQIDEQHREADRLNRKFRTEFRILKGIESDILADGSLDYPDDVLESFEFVVASIHGRFKLDRKAQTDRLLRAVANPHTTIQAADAQVRL